MKTIIFIISNLLIILAGCKTDSVINPDLIKNDWVSEIDRYDNIYRLYVEDSLMFETLTPALVNYSPLSDHRLTNISYLS